MYLMTFPWHFHELDPWHDKERTTYQNLGSYIPLVVLTIWLEYREIWLGTYFDFFFYSGCVFSRSNTIGHISVRKMAELANHWLHDALNVWRYIANYNTVRWIFAPGTMHFRPRYDTFWPCGLFTLLQFCKHPPSKINMKPGWEFKLWGYFQWVFWKFYHHIVINDSFLNNQKSSDLE